MLYVLTALKCEAAALTGVPGTVIVTGVGDRCRARLDSIALTSDDRILNIGCAAGRHIGSAYLANRIENSLTGRVFYPDMRKGLPLPETRLVTVADEVNEILEDAVFDMEAAIICEWALKTVAPSSVAFIKAVSDDGTTRPSAADVTQLIRRHLTGIKQVAESLAEVRDAQAVKAVPEDLADELRLSQYMRNEFASLRHYAEVSGRKAELEQMLDDMRDEGRIPVKDKRAGKEILDEIFARLR